MHLLSSIKAHQDRSAVQLEMAYDGLVSEQPAFASHKTYQRSKRNNSTSRKRLCDCCFSVANLLIILASILALIQCVQFLFDQPLYDYGDYLLGVRFYRQIIYIIVIVPLLFLVPIYNAIDALFIAASTHPSTASVLFNLVSSIHLVPPPTNF